MIRNSLKSALLCILLSACAAHPPRIEAAKTEAKIHRFEEGFKNSADAMKAHYVILVSIDGFRHDYAERYKAENLLDIGKHGVAAKSLIPVYPSKTFPNHYAIITGLYADEHGIVSNEFYDPDMKETYNAFKGGARDARWYDGEPLWITAEKNGFVSASYFWVASEAPIQGRYPNYYVEFNEKVPNADRVHQVIAWLKAPDADRPHFITLYFSDVDHAGHRFGPDAPETAKAVQDVDGTIGLLRAEIAKLNLPVDLIVVSDHGMDQLSQDKIVTLDGVDLSAFKVGGGGTMISLYLNPGESKTKIDKVIAQVNALKRPVRAWRRAEMKSMHFSKTARAGDVVIEADAPYSVYVKKPLMLFARGDHGWNPARFDTVRGIFFAEGPDFKKGLSIPAFENVHIFPMVAKILGWKKLPKVSGRLDVLNPALTRGALTSH